MSLPDLSSEETKSYDRFTEDELKCGGNGPGKPPWAGGSAQLETIFKEKIKALSKKYLKKIKTLQQNKRRQETRIERLTKEVRSLREKNGVQAAYIDVLCGMLGDDFKEKFQNRQSLGILGDVKGPGCIVGRQRDTCGDASRNDLGDGDLSGKDKDLYCIEDITEEEQVEFC